MRFHIETYGCTANLGNSREAEAALVEMGGVRSPIEKADLVIVNTCAVTAKTQRKVVKRLRQLQGKRLVIAGCLPASVPGAVEGISCLMKVGILRGPAARDICRALHTASGDDPGDGEPRHEDHLLGIVNISEGCVGGCSYCLVRKARGRLISRDMDEILGMVEDLVKDGVVEIQLAAQDASAYGMDTGSSLPDLLCRIARIPGRHMIRVGMMNPDTLEPHIEDMHRALRSPRIYSFLHLPIQSGSDRILERMNRGYTAEKFLNVATRFREAVLDLTLNTDVIAGFPGETKGDFLATLELLRKVEPDKVNVTRYSSRPGTPAWDLYDMPDRIKKDRSRALTKVWKEIAKERMSRHMGTIQTVLVTEVGKGRSMKARTENYTQVVVRGTPPLGSQLRVRITGTNPFYITGEAVQSQDVQPQDEGNAL